MGNGQWNRYDPAGYVAAHRRIVAALAQQQPALRKRTALVWDFTCDAAHGHTEYMPYYPGDEWVDWWGVNAFSGPLHDPLHGSPNSMPNSPCVRGFVTAAASRGFPVLIAESQPRYIGAQSRQHSWSEWFRPFFDELLAHPSVKGFSYVDRDCTSNRQYKHWGDERVETGVVGPQYLAAVLKRDGNSGFVHAANLSATCAALRCECGVPAVFFDPPTKIDAITV